MTDKMHIHGGNIYSFDQIHDFSANINFRGMPESVARAAVDAVAASVHYPDPDYDALKQSIALRDQVSPENIICGNGAAELMFALAMALKPQKAVLAIPSFFEYEQALRVNDCEIVYAMLHRENDFRLDVSFLKNLNKEVDLVILGNPNNPTGQLIEKEILNSIIQKCREEDIFLVLDESFLDFLSKEDLACTCSGIPYSRNFSKLFVLKSYTKMYAMPGLRFGYGICSDKVLLGKMRQMLQPWNVSIPAAKAAQAASRLTAFAEETAVLVSENRLEMKNRMEQAGYQVYSSVTNFLLFEGDPQLKERCLKKEFLIRDCSNFPGLEYDETQKKKFYRICIRSREENEALLTVLTE